VKRGGAEIRAVFFDRDGTLCRRSHERSHEFHLWVRARSQYDPVPFARAQSIVWDEFFGSHRSDMVVDMGVEARFWVDYWMRSLELLGVNESHLDEALDKFVFFKFSELYPETRDVLSTLHECGFRLGVISDTFPSLGDSLYYLGLGHFFDVVIDSASVGAMKPSPIIYRRAVDKLDVPAEACLFVDDTYQGVKGARVIGMHALWLDRLRVCHDLRTGIIADLRGTLAYLGIHYPKS
jgi:putative hydrolase of the HAD superfamily